MTRPIGRPCRIAVKPGDDFDQMQRIERRHQIFGSAAAHQFAIKLDVVDAADHHHLGRRIADFGQTVEFVAGPARPESLVSTIRRLGVTCPS